MAKSKRNPRNPAASLPVVKLPLAAATLPVPTPTKSMPDTGRKPDRVLPSGVRIALGVVLTAAMLWPIAQYYEVVWRYALNVPLQDDFDSGLEFIDRYAFQPHTFFEKLKLIFSQHNEHRIVLNRLAFIGEYGLTGQLNFRHLMFVGNSAVLCLFGILLGTAFRRETGVWRLLYQAPLSFLLFQLVYWELTIWGMASIQNFFVLVFAWASLVALYGPPDGRIWFAGALLLAIAATYTSSNGLLTFFVGAIGLIITKQYRRLAIWSVVGSVAIGLYLWGYTRPGHHPPLLGALFSAPGQFGNYLFTLLGNSLSASLEGAARAGKWLVAAVVGLLAFALYRRRFTAFLPVWSILGFLLATCLLITIGRSGFGVGQALSSRYTILSVSLVCALYILLVEVVSSQRGKVLVSVVCLLVSIGWYGQTHRRGLAGVINLTNQLNMNTALYNENPQNLLLVWGDPAKAKVIYQRALATGTYQVPPITPATLSSQPQPFDGAVLNSTNDVVFDAKPYLTPRYVVFYESWAFVNGLETESATIRLVAQSPTGSYAFGVLKHLRYDLANQNPQTLYAGFSAVIDKKMLKPGRYQLWLAITNKNVVGYQPLNITIDSQPE